MFPCAIRRRSASGVWSTNSTWSAARTMASGTVSRRGAPVTLAEHGEGLADPGRGAEVDPELSPVLLAHDLLVREIPAHYQCAGRSGGPVRRGNEGWRRPRGMAAATTGSNPRVASGGGRHLGAG